MEVYVHVCMYTVKAIVTLLWWYTCMYMSRQVCLFASMSVYK